MVMTGNKFIRRRKGCDERSFYAFVETRTGDAGTLARRLTGSNDCNCRVGGERKWENEVEVQENGSCHSAPDYPVAPQPFQNIYGNWHHKSIAFLVLQ